MNLQKLNSHLRIDIYLASRHYPNITVKASEGLILESQAEHAEDIETYISSKLVMREGWLKTELQSSLESKSNGVFLWIMLVLRELNRRYDDGAAPTQLLSTLSETLADLTDLLRSIITGGASDERLLPAMIWVLAARWGSLLIGTLYDAIQLSTGQISEHSSNFLELDKDSKYLFILSASKGLLELPLHDSMSGNDPVQFTHETVREHLIQEGLACLCPSMKRNPEGSSHAMVAS